MVVFNELYISEDGNRLVVGCSIRDLSIYAGMHISRIYIEHYVNALTSGEPSSKAIQIYDDAEAKTPLKEVRASLDASDARVEEMFGLRTFSGGLFYAIVECDGELDAAAAGLPCGYDEARAVGVVLDWCLVYTVGMRYIAEMNRRCSDPCRDMSGFDGFVVLWHSMRIASESGDYRVLEDVWKKFIRIAGTGGRYVSGGCGCGK